MNHFRFANLEWLHAIWGIAFLAILLIGLELRGHSILQRFMSPRMQLRLVQKPALSRRLLGIGLFCLALLCFVFAMMRPQWGMTMQATTRVDSQIMICLDVSKSMLAEDVVPNRLERAKTEIESLLGIMDAGQQVGLIAFAGKAAVQCPLTTDFGFLRLILAETGPASVGLGGTKIGEALRKAVDGFSDAGDVNRLILLITDGEDHDSFPLDAAQAAKEKGVRVVSIGFGDEAGSKIEITDPTTGVRTFVTDVHGQPVTSRLDGDTLRDIALETEGAYIPAGTGALDLDSIYQAHIATLLKGRTDSERRTIRNEAYQWCVLFGFLCWITSFLTTIHLSTTPRSTANPPRAPKSPGLSRAARQGGAIVLLLGLPSLPLLGQDGAEARVLDSTTSTAVQPRQLYNDALSSLASDPENAAKLLGQARNDAGIDGELRYRSIYNLGWVEVNRADALLQEEPEQALKHLQLAASRFQEAVRIRPKANSARHNLEIISRRILELTDSLAQKSPTDFTQQLEQIIASQREHQLVLQEIVQQIASQPSAVEGLRDRFRKLGVSQRQTISNMERLAENARREIDAAQDALANAKAAAPNTASSAASEDPQDAEKRLRMAQLTAALRYVDSSLSWMNRARSFTRRLQADRTFLRWSAALTDARRARDQLRNPIEILGVLTADSLELATLTQQMASQTTPELFENLATEDSQVPLSDAPTVAPETAAAGPALTWLTDEYLTELQVATTQRVQELHAMLEAAVPAETPNESDEATASDAAADLDAQSLLDSIRQALPLIQRAQEAFATAEVSLASQDFPKALGHQTDAIQALRAAAEFFDDYRRLIETMYADERIVQLGLKTGGSMPGEERRPLQESLLEIQQTNLERSHRLAKLFAKEILKLDAAESDASASSPAGSPSTPPAAPGDEAAPPDLTAQRERFETAQALLKALEADMDQLALQLARTDLFEAGPPSVAETPDTSAPSPAEPAAPELPDQETTESDSPKPEPSDTDAPERTATDGEATEPTPEVETTAKPEPTMVEQESAESVAPENQAEASVSSALDTQFADSAVSKLEDLRRLFFTIIEHLKDTTQRQAQLKEATEDLLVQSPRMQDTAQRAPLQNRQRILEQISSQIAEELEREGQAASEAGQSVPLPSAASGSSTPAPSEADQQSAEALVEAAKLVAAGSHAMQLAANALVPQSLVPQSQPLPKDSTSAAAAPQSESELSEPDLESQSESELPESETRQTPDAPSNTDTTLEESRQDASAEPPAVASPQIQEQQIQEQQIQEQQIQEQQVLEQQAIALEKLLAALELLNQAQQSEPPPQPEENQSGEDENQEQQKPQPDGDAQQQQNMNSSQMLQAIREREAQRRVEKQRHNTVRSGGVDKDW
ncbi:VWA domain-containing protein [Aureliella helgolandensis]|uniref:von Willebrand factor type A domain protein n=1 Tax=Aureliella helgolandensis TaxID=2527968 RepID=A0A518G6V0_9BACT|nr:VWA domain-containing protein [Aureliella helgolandensis]QDV24309.1 von Willebrand factor type A domain protein [Aureliella helgolandensis]